MATDASNLPAADAGGLFVGLISGTSVDGIDAALVRFDPSPHLVGARTYPLDPGLAQVILSASQVRGQLTLDELGRLDTRLGYAFADATLALLASIGVEAGAVRAIGSHGQTLRHRPDGESPFTLQLGDGNVIAERTGIDTVADFRRRDVAAGGHGAPLVPAFHAAILRDRTESRAILNIGGIANLTLLPAQGVVRGFDTGPGNGLMDAWCLLHRREAYDRGGAFAADGAVDDALLQRLMADPWLALPPPKSTGRDQFHLDWLAERMAGLALAPANVQATLCAFSAHSIVQALLGQLPDCRRVIVCGGGVHNLTLMARLREQLPGMAVDSSASHGVDPDFMEAMAFAWLARERLAGRPGNLPEVTGARGPRLLGTVYPG